MFVNHWYAENLELQHNASILSVQVEKQIQK